MSKPNLLSLVFVMPGTGIGEAMDDAADLYGKEHVIQNTNEMVVRSISMCINQQKLIGKLTFASHGFRGRFRVGKEVISANYLDPCTIYYRHDIYSNLARLKDWFDPTAQIWIQACHCGGGEEGEALLKILSKLWNRPVIAFTGEIRFGSEVEYDDGGFTVCVNEMCLHL